MSMLDPHLPDGTHEWRDGRKLVKHGEQLCIAGTDTLAGRYVWRAWCPVFFLPVSASLILLS